VQVFIFIFGLLVTLVFGGAVATIWWAAIGDGRTDAEMRRREDGAGTDPLLRGREEPAGADAQVSRTA
jgi:hypothetical protein